MDGVDCRRLGLPATTWTKVAGVRPSFASAGFVAAFGIAVAEAQSCGISGTMVGANIDPKITEPTCDVYMSTNCSTSYWPGVQCPEACALVAPSNVFSCLFTCVKPDSCASVRPGLALANVKAKICERCGVTSCRRCKNQETCEECFADFELSQDGKACSMKLDASVDMIAILSWVAGALGALILLASVWPCIMGFPEDSTANQEAIRRARLHRHLVKVQDWNLTGNQRHWRHRYSLFTNVHCQEIVGVGLPLFYNSFCFLIIVAMLCFAVTSMTFRNSSLSNAFRSFARSNADVFHNARPLNSTDGMMLAPAMESSPLFTCGFTNSSRITEELDKFSEANFKALGVLYVLLFLLSLAYMEFQRRVTKFHDRHHSTMADFAIMLDGLPAHVTDEEKLRLWFAQEIETDLGFPMEVVGVSICYDYQSMWGQVDALLGRLLEKRQIELGLICWDLSTGAMQGKSQEETYSCDEVEVCHWFDPNNDARLKSSGKAFAVFENIAAAEKVLRYYKEGGFSLEHPEAPGDDVEVLEVFMEPISVFWWFAGVEPKELRKRTAIAFCKIVLLIFAVELFIWVPFNHAFVMPFARTGVVARGNVLTVAGTLLGNVNMFVCIAIFFTGFGLGFLTKVRMDVFIFWSNTLLAIVNSSYNFFIVMQTTLHTDRALTWGSFYTPGNIVFIGRCHELARSVYSLLCPGMLFYSYLMGPIMAGVVPYMWNTLLMKLIYVWGCLPFPLLRILKVFLPWAPESLKQYPARNAEKGLEPPEIGLSWDYAAFIVIPTICFTQLFYVSPYVVRTFQALALWAIFYYCYCRYMHLRFNKAAYFNGCLLDANVGRAWSIPLSTVAVVWIVWGQRCGRIPPSIAIQVTAFFFSVGFWLVCVMHVRPFGRQSSRDVRNKSYSEVEEHQLATWFNCNPVFMLKCEYYFKAAPKVATHSNIGPYARLGSTPELESHDMIVPYEVGKEYLFFTRQQQESLNAAQNDILEFETYIEWFFALWCGKRDGGARLCSRFEPYVSGTSESDTDDDALREVSLTGALFEMSPSD